MTVEFAYLFLAGFVAGILNSIAGGGTFITFPALLFAGVPPISANATNIFASCSGYLSGAYAFRHDLKAHTGELPKYIIFSFLGGICGAWLLLQTSEVDFEESIPWLMLFATTLFILGAKINEGLRTLSTRHRHASRIGKVLALIFLLVVSVYGGFFGAGFGIIALSYLAIIGHTNINAMNGLKLLISASVALVAIAIFIYHGKIAWEEGMAVLVGNLTGGYLAARISRHVPQTYVKAIVTLASTVVTAYFFFDLYAL